MKIEMQESIARLVLNDGKANAIGPAFLESFNSALDEVEAGDARALVVTGHGHFFSAGLALPELVNLKGSEMAAFMGAFSAFMLRVFQFQRPVVAAVNGHAIAGGCVLALMADARIMARGKHKIGLNEVALGIGLPAVVTEPLRAAVPVSSWRRIALEGELLEPNTAADVGLVDALCDPNALEQEALAAANRLAAGGPEAFAQIKKSLRRPAVAAIAAFGESDTRAWMATWESEAARTRIAAAVDRLGG